LLTTNSFLPFLFFLELGRQNLLSVRGLNCIKIHCKVIVMRSIDFLVNSFEAIFESNLDCVKILSKKGLLERINISGCDLMEIENVDEALGRDWFADWSPQIVPMVKKSFKECLNGNRSSFTGMCKTAKGNAKWWKVVLSPIQDREGQVAHILSISKDITKVIVQNQTLEEFKARLDIAVDVGEVIVWDWSLDEEYINISDSKENILGFEDRSITVKSEEFFGKIDSVDKNRILSEFEIAKNNNLTFSSDFKYNRSAKESLTLSLSASYVPTENSGRWIGIIHDISSQIDEKSELRLSKEKASAANAIKSQFVASVSHELRSPMNAIIGYSDLLYDLHELEDSRSREYSSQIKKSGEHLLRLLNDILDISKMEAGQLIIEKNEVNILHLLDDSIGILKVQSEQSKVTLDFDFGPNVPNLIYTDEARLKQIILNLAGNAIKFTSEGEVKIHLTFIYKTKDTGALSIVVSDTGVGIPKHAQKKLFSPFSQADESIYRQFGGTGLGLHLSRMIAETLGGNLDLLDSEAGVGSTFQFILPIEISSNEDSFVERYNKAQEDLNSDIPIKVDFLKGKKILVADDVIENRRLIKIFLEDSGANIVFAVDGVDVLEKCSKTPFDFIFMDVMMPNMSGIEATEQLRKAGHTIPIVALTAHTMKKEIAACIAAGCNSHLAKPVRKEQIISCLAFNLIK